MPAPADARTQEFEANFTSTCPSCLTEITRGQAAHRLIWGQPGPLQEAAPTTHASCPLVHQKVHYRGAPTPTGVQLITEIISMVSQSTAHRAMMGAPQMAPLQISLDAQGLVVNGRRINQDTPLTTIHQNVRAFWDQTVDTVFDRQGEPVARLTELYANQQRQQHQENS